MRKLLVSIAAIYANTGNTEAWLAWLGFDTGPSQQRCSQVSTWWPLRESLSGDYKQEAEAQEGDFTGPEAGAGTRTRAVVADVDTQDPRLVNVHGSWLVKTSFVDYFHNILLKLGDALI